MAEGGIAASMGNVNSKDNWQVHFRDTMRGGKFLNHPRMAELHAQGGAGPGLGAGDLRRAVRPHRRTAGSASATSAATSTRGSPTSATAPAWS